tara:strand:- start:10046 stop:10675 length:630 start_codon:yes stop_codon:yes gene_type:complete
MDDNIFDKGRVIAFSDAVFSIALTLLVLEVAVPTSEAVSKYETWDLLAARIPDFIGLVVSFFVTALYWIAHMRVTKYASSINTKLLWINIGLLFFIVLLPFSTGFYVSGFNVTGPFVFYCLNLSGIGFFNYLMIRYIIKKEKEETGLTKNKGKWEKTRSLNSFLAWILAGVLAFVWPSIARYTFVLIFVFNPIIDKYYRKKILNEAAKE